MLPIKQKESLEQGITLIEVLVSQLILCLITVSFLSFFSSAAHWISIAGNETRASNYAGAILDTLRSESDQLDDANSGMLAEKLLPGQCSASSGLSARIITMERQSPLTNLYKVCVVVYPSGNESKPILQMGSIIRRE